MRTLLLIGLITVAIPAFSASPRIRGEMFAAKLGCGDSPTGLQRAYAYFNGTSLDDWTAESAALHREKLPDGSIIGVKIEPVPPSYYERTPFRDMNYAAEMVEVSLFDLSHDTPRLLGRNFAGASSIQSYFGKVASDKPFDLTHAGLTLVLEKTNCVPLMASR
ncbi:MAG TPA: hypothetical protein VJ722_07785 [Rhodanobacteraceae bacterium]|nr:hypothetical protein [Rhodanobacteraceae bacterium]